MEHAPQREKQFSDPKVEQIEDALPLNDVRVQIALMKMVDPDRHTAAELWTTEDVGKDSMAKRFSDYRESAAHAGEVIHLSDTDQLNKILEEVKKPTQH